MSDVYTISTTMSITLGSNKADEVKIKLLRAPVPLLGEFAVPVS